jgi:pimeloyl-ACP methyl ester carboxylesterase
MIRPVLTALAAALLLSAASSAHAQAPAAAAASIDYGRSENWLCLPGRKDACASDNTATVIQADGRMTRETWSADPKAPVDCFYVYPTVSNDPSVLSDMTANDEERRVVEQQLARFASRCRVFAPLYRQFTLTALRASMMGQPLPGGAPANAPRPDTGYTDVVDAWRRYLKTENKGRGVILIGHSQGSGVLTRLLANEIDGKPEQKLLVSAILAGTNLPVDPGKTTGLLKSIPTCTAAGQTGCVVAFATFRSNVPPPAATLFGRPRETGTGRVAACTNPAALGGGPAPLDAYLSTAANGQDPTGWVKGGARIETPFVKVPGLLTGACVSRDGLNWLEVTVRADPADPRLDDIRGDVVAGGQVNAAWGLHLIDVNLVMGDLVTLVGEQSRAWAARKP